MIYLKTGVGIELRGKDMLLAALQSNFGNFSRATFTCFERIEDYSQLNQEELRGKLSRFFRDNNLGKEAVVLGIPRSEIVFRHLELPPEVKDNLREVIRYQVQAFEPSEENGFYYDYTLLGGQPGQPGTKRLTVLVAMARKAYLDRQLALLRECGIRPATVTCGSMGLANLWLSAQKTEGTTCFLVDADASSLELFALRNGQFAYSHEAARPDARSWGDCLLAEVNEAVSRLRLGPDGELEKIVLTGESAATALQEIEERIPGCELLEKSLPCDVPEKNRPLLTRAAATLGLAFTGGAARPAVGLNLLPPVLTRRHGRWGIAVAAALGVVILLLLAGLGLREAVQNRGLLSRLKEENQKLEASVRKVRSLETEGKTLAAQEKILEDIVNDRDRNLDILRELTMILPQNTFLQTYTNRNGVITLAGESGSSSDLIPQLEKSPLLKDVVQRGSVSRNQTTGRDRFSFEARLER